MTDQPKAFAAVTCTTILWGVSFIGTKMALETLTVFSYVFFRFFLASIIFIFLLQRRGMPRLDRSMVIRMIVLALLQPFGYFLFETLGLKYTAATKASLLIALIPLAVAGASRLILKEKIRKKTLAGIILSVGGVFLLVIGGPEGLESLGGAVKGDLFILGAVFSGAFYMILTRDISRKLSPFYITAFQIFLGTLFFLPFFLVDLPKVDWPGVSLRSAGGVLYNVLGGTLGGFLCYNFALTHLKASTVAVFVNGIPIVTALAAWIILGEVLAPLQMAGGAIVLLSVILTTGGGKRAASPPLRS